MSFRSKAQALLAKDGRVAVVTLARVEGSSPREEGAQMLVAPSGFLGSIGGGTLEWQAMAEAQRLLRKGNTRNSRSYCLGPDLGQCCGGRVVVETEVIESEEALEKALAPGVPARQIIIYGAGHVGKALVLFLAQSGFAITWCDPRDGAIPAVVPANVLAATGAELLQPVLLAQQGALVVVMSHSHALDFEVVDAALRNDAIARVLLIGSLTKRARFLSRLKSAGHSAESLSRLICPIGDGAIAGKTPYAVALSTAHQLVALDEVFCRAQTVEKPLTERRAG